MANNNIARLPHGNMKAHLPILLMNESNENKIEIHAEHDGVFNEIQTIYWLAGSIHNIHPCTVLLLDD